MHAAQRAPFPRALAGLFPRRRETPLTFYPATPVAGEEAPAAYPPEDNAPVRPGTGPYTALEQPSFTPAAAAVTGPLPVTSDSPRPEPVPDPVPRLVLDSRPALYTGPGWTRALCMARVRDGEWEDLNALLEKAWGRNHEQYIAARRHVREAMAELTRQGCAQLGVPGAAGLLLRRVAELAEAERRAGGHANTNGGLK